MWNALSGALDLTLPPPQLFESAKLTERIVEAFNSKEPKGCLGHLSRVSHNLIINASVQKYLGSEEWQNFTLGKLHQLYKIESAQLGQMDLFELFPELVRDVLCVRARHRGVVCPVSCVVVSACCRSCAVSL